MLKYTKKITKIVQDDKSVKKPKTLLFILVGNGWQWCCATNIKCFFCSRKTKSSKFVTLSNTNYSILGQYLLKDTRKITKLPTITKQLKKEENHYFSHWVAMGESHNVLAIWHVSAVVQRLNEVNFSSFSIVRTKFSHRTCSKIPTITTLPTMRKSIKHQKHYIKYWVGTPASCAVLARSSVFPVAGRLNQLNLWSFPRLSTPSWESASSNIPKKITKLPIITNHLKRPKALLFPQVGNGWQ